MPLLPQSVAPDFHAQDPQGQWHSLKDYLGQWVLLYFYPKDNTPGCTAEACNLRDHFEILQGKLVVLGISHDSPESHARFAQKHRLPFTLLSDPEKKIITAYQAKGFLWTKRLSYLIDPHGKIEKVYPSVRPSQHAQEVLEDYQKFHG